MAARSAFWDRLADRYAAQPVADQAAYDTKLVATRRLLRPEMSVFEFGCGTGSTAISHAPFVRHIRAIDFSPRMIEIATQKAMAAQIHNVEFGIGSIETVQLAPECYDVVMGHSILHLLKDKQDAIGKSFAALKPGGAFVSSTSCLGEMMPFSRFLAPISNRIGLLPHFDVMTPDQLRSAMVKAGFSVEHEWQPSKKAALFMVARKPGRGESPGPPPTF
ncbi:Ubiquinone/menaquinone biosynthesis C-methylase UbiE [Devosia crocina]|uniref:Ubiquinone/menaquinone biosynthesis C-methylase UbiE n=1 Tax=Devosia crocina TaxID=429728 RepID=A0A1I7MW68_9HYPH|nr:class I SAM-dependent methyltransferase [Devosia crocina]SFV26615.1 Ubiquinone/menaquinone biosynthesis C-methylase UbiE [Devosia crocina]